MTKTTAPRARTLNLYTVEQDGQPVAQAMAISQAEAVRLYVESVQQPTMSARLSSPLEARTLAGLPLLSRDTPASPAVSPVFGAVVDAEWAPSGDPVTVLDGGLASAQEAAAAPLGEPMPSAPSTAALTVSHVHAVAEQATADTELKRQAEASAVRRTHGGKPVAMYRNPADGASWSGRGLKPRWLVDAIEAGRTQDEFLIDPNGAQA